MTRVKKFLAEMPNEWRDICVTLAVAIGVFALLSVGSYDCMYPAVWDEVAVAAGLRPPATPFPGCYRGIVSLMFTCFSAGTVHSLLQIFGRLCIALAAAGIYLVIFTVMPFVLRLHPHMGRLATKVMAVISMLATVFFTCAEPVWRAGQTFSPVTLSIVLLVSAMLLFLRYMKTGRILPLYGCFAVLGTMSADAVIGLAFTFLAVVGVIATVPRMANPFVRPVSPLVDGLVRNVVYKRLSYVWLAFFVVAIGVNAFRFVCAGGMEAAGESGITGLAFIYLKGAFDGVHDAATGHGWLLGLVFSVGPFLFAITLLPRAWHDDSFLPYMVGILYLIVAMMAMFPIMGAHLLRGWIDLSGKEVIVSDMLWVAFVLLDIAAISMAFTVFGVDTCCRNYRRIAQMRYPESMLAPVPARLADSLGKERKLRLRIFWAAVAVAPFLTIPVRLGSPESSLSGIVNEYVAEVIRETDGCDTLFTDGSFDAVLELEANRLGRTLRCLALTERDTPRARMIRVRAASNPEDRDLLECDAASALRTWVLERPRCIARIAVQLGFEVWRRAKLPSPPCSGLVALPKGVGNEERIRALAACRRLGDMACELGENGAVKDCRDPVFRKMFSFVVWRIARLAQLRSRVAAIEGRNAESLREAAVADELDAVNPSLQGLRREMAWLRRQNGGVLTPREGLVIGLARADFALAGRYAAPVLAADPDDPRANFAMGMMYYTDEQYARAERYLSRCLVKRPEDAAVHNNLALVKLKIGKYDEAETHARRAVANLPDSLEVKKTLERILAEKSKRKEKS